MLKWKVIKSHEVALMFLWLGIFMHKHAHWSLIEIFYNMNNKFIVSVTCLVEKMREVSSTEQSCSNLNVKKKTEKRKKTWLVGDQLQNLWTF